MLPVLAATAFSPGQIALSAALAGIVSLLILRWRVRSLAVGEMVLLALIAAASVFAWRQSANMPPLNSDGLPGVSAIDMLCPVITYVALGVYAAFRRPPDVTPWAQARALVTLAARVVTVVTL